MGATRLYQQISSNIQNRIQEAEKRENNIYVVIAKYKTKAMWQIKNKELGNPCNMIKKFN